MIKIGTTKDLVDGKGREVIVDGRRIALFKIDGDYHAIANLCLHRGGPLADGELNGHIVTCPWHGWKYDVRTGAFEIIPTLKVKAYRVEQKGEDLYVEID
jgi:nitrite reductase/ring-hydroxylating ferredoxin subunit